MAIKTGYTIVAAPDAVGCSARPAHQRVWGSLAAMLIVTVLTPSIGMSVTPGGRPQYRSVSRNQSTENSHDSAANNGDRNSGGGLLGFRPFRKTDDRTDQPTLLDTVPMERLTPQAKQKLGAITDQPTLYRRLPTQAIRCDEELFLFLTRKPEAIIGIWDLMGITNVQATRVGPYKLDASDGSGTTCKIDLLYGDRNLHVFMADGGYDGKFTQNPIGGKGVFVFKSTYATASDGSTTVTGTLDCYIKFDHLGADLIARTLGGLIGKSADHNFVETAKFISQISQASQNNPEAMLEMVDRMPQVDAQTKSEFMRVIMNTSRRHLALQSPAAKIVHDHGIRDTTR